jgi:ABC-type multidrug transport system fused ATPase/permease subunit
MEDRIQNLEADIASLNGKLVILVNKVEASEAKQSTDDLDKKKLELSEKRAKLAEMSFKTVLDSDIHLDNKASRILSAMAFLTSASAAIFAKAYSPNWITQENKQLLTRSLSTYINSSQLPSVVNTIVQTFQKQSIIICGLDLSLFSFATYILFVLLGAGLYLYALGPSLNIPSWFINEKIKDGRTNNIVKSLLFFKTISSVERDIWESQWTLSNYELQEKMMRDLITESYLIAQKVETKNKLMSGGSIFFRLSIASLIPLVCSLFTIELKLKIISIYLGLILLFIIFIIGTLQRPSKDSLTSWLPTILWSLLTFLCISGIFANIF